MEPYIVKHPDITPLPPRKMATAVSPEHAQRERDAYFRRSGTSAEAFDAAAAVAASRQTVPSHSGTADDEEKREHGHSGALSATHDGEEMLRNVECMEAEEVEDCDTLTEKQKAFLREMRKCPHPGLACAAAGVSPATIRFWLGKSPPFRLALDDARNHALGILYSVAWREATEGHDEPVFQGGQLVGHKRVMSQPDRRDLLRAEMPEKFAPERPQAGPATVVLGTPEQVAAVVRRLSPTAQPAQPVIDV